jgi:transcription elongation factor GreA
LTLNMINGKQVQLTKQGLDSLQSELGELKESKRPALVERLANARAEGDLKENSDYHNAKDELEFLDGRIEELEDVLKNAVVVESVNGSSVTIGNSVKVKVNGSEHTYHIVGEWEANPTEKKISHTSPLGQALIGKEKGEKVEVEAPVGTVVYEILDVS